MKQNCVHVNCENAAMNKFDPAQLGHFIGAERYYRISNKNLLSYGTKYLAEQAALAFG